MEQLRDSDKLGVNNRERNHAAPIQIIAVCRSITPALKAFAEGMTSDLFLSKVLERVPPALVGSVF
jgi:hypothetical protein